MHPMTALEIEELKAASNYPRELHTPRRRLDLAIRTVGGSALVVGSALPAIFGVFLLINAGARSLELETTPWFVAGAVLFLLGAYILWTARRLA